MPRMRRAVLTIALVLLLTVAALAQTATAADDQRNEITTVLNEQVSAWNKGDLKGYMEGYWKSPELTFFSGGTITKGWQPTLDRYRQRYQSGGREMGKLDFSALRIEMLGPRSAFARGSWHLTMSDGKAPHGRFTLVFRKFPDGWKIIHDHTSAAE
jgi:beta-aspartyl-peptidase (threonine type)